MQAYTASECLCLHARVCMRMLSVFAMIHDCLEGNLRAELLTLNVLTTRCDLKGPTVTIVATADGRIFGGYASTPWSAGTTGKYADDPAAFLFILADEYGRPSLKIGQSSTSAEDAVFHDSDLGPCWGRALGLQLDILAYSSSDFTSSVKYRIPEGQDDRTFLAGSYNGWDIQEVGVWLV